MIRNIFIIFALAAVAAFTGCKAAEVSNVNTAAQEAPAAPTSYATAGEALAAGNKFFEDGDTLKAIAALEEATAQDPELAEAYFKLGIAYALYDDADDTVTGEPEETTVIKNGKQIKENKSRSTVAFEKAVDGYKKIIKANDEDDVAYFDLGRAYNKLNEDDDALKALQRAAKLKPEDTEYLTELGAIQIKLAKYHEAVTTLKKALEIDAENVEAQELLEKAEAGSKRVDYAQPKNGEDANRSKRTRDRDDEADAPDDSNSNSNRSPKPKPSPSVLRTPIPAKTPAKPAQKN